MLSINSSVSYQRLDMRKSRLSPPFVLDQLVRLEPTIVSFHKHTSSPDSPRFKATFVGSSWDVSRTDEEELRRIGNAYQDEHKSTTGFSCMATGHSLGVSQNGEIEWAGHKYRASGPTSLWRLCRDGKVQSAPVLLYALSWRAGKPGILWDGDRDHGLEVFESRSGQRLVSVSAAGEMIAVTRLHLGSYHPFSEPGLGYGFLVWQPNVSEAALFDLRSYLEIPEAPSQKNLKTPRPQ